MQPQVVHVLDANEENSGTISEKVLGGFTS